jgi:hypothetical protein
LIIFSIDVPEGLVLCPVRIQEHEWLECPEAGLEESDYQHIHMWLCNITSKLGI